MCRQLGSVPPHSPRGPWLGTRSNVTGMDISDTVAASGIHRSFLSVMLQFWERLFRIAEGREGAQSHMWQWLGLCSSEYLRLCSRQDLSGCDAITVSYSCKDRVCVDSLWLHHVSLHARLCPVCVSE